METGKKTSALANIIMLMKFKEGCYREGNQRNAIKSLLLLKGNRGTRFHQSFIFFLKAQV